MKALNAGSRIGPYEVVSAIGSGGMGEVYRARDTRLNRDVALKTLLPPLLADAERLARFRREAQVLAALNHPNIAQIYGFEDGAASCLVMELVAGETLSDRIARGPIPWTDAIPIARQIAEALEAAHDLGIVHRDLKPSNIKVRDDGAVKVLDFGLAKAIEGDALVGPDSPASPSLATVTSPAMTGSGMILGTAAYMAPEQARGKIVDKRADVWAFGVVLYEMLAGRRLFKAEDVSDTMAAVLRQPIDLEALPVDTPRAVRLLLERCLEREPRQRLRDIGEARISLERVLANPTGSETVITTVARAPAPSRARTLLPWLLFATTAVALAVVLGPWRSSPSHVSAGVTRHSVSIGVPGSLVVDAGPAAVLSPDGRTLVLRVRHDTTTRLYVRRLEQLAPVELAGTEHATNPFFSSDGRQIGFFASGGLKTVPVGGGAVTTLTDATTGRGAAWDRDGDILFQSSVFMQTPLVRINAKGVRTDRGTTLAADETTHRWPQILPGGMVLYSGHSSVSNWDDGTVRVQTTPGVPGKVVQRGGYHARYVPSGHLLYVHAGTLHGVRFNLERLEVTSTPVPIIDHIVATPVTGGAQYSVAADGTLAYIPGHASSVDARMHWMTALGETSALKTTPGVWGNPRFSPNGKKIALQVVSGSYDQIAIYDIASDRLTQLTFDAANHRMPIWTPDGQQIVYASDASGAQNLYARRADGSGEAQRLTTSPATQVACSIDPGGRSILYSENTGNAPASLWILPLDRRDDRAWTPGPPRVFSDTPAFEALCAFSPDGRLVAYMSSAQGPFEIYVRALAGGGPWRVSTSGGAHPVWSRSGRELLFTTEDQIMSAAFQYDGKRFTHETPRPWSSVRYATAGPTRKFDLHPDGKRVLVASPDTTGVTAYDKVTFVTNFFDELERLLPAGR